MLRQRAARKEVIAALRTSPIAGYGLYRLMEDAGLVSARTRKEIDPIVASVEQRMKLDEADLQVQLPMKFEPLTDEEFDTLTFLIAEVIRKFADAVSHTPEDLALAELRGINGTLQEHVGHTSSLRRELTTEHALFPILRAWGEKFQPHETYETREIRPGDFFHVRNLARSMRWLPKRYVIERRMNRGEIVCVEEVWRKGYLRVRRLGYAAKYSRTWGFRRARKQLRKDNSQAVVYQEEGQLYRLKPVFEEPVSDFLALFEQHSVDYSYDPEVYRPRVDRS